MMWLALTVLPALGQTPASTKPFFVFDGTLYSNKPDLSVYGIQPIKIVYGQQFGHDWFKQTDLLPPIETVQTVARQAQQKGAPVVIDIEHWPLKGDPGVVETSLTKYLTVLKWFHDAAPGLPLGYYAEPPLREYSRAIKLPSSQEYRFWMSQNDHIRPLADAVDSLYPSLYTWYEDRAGWRKFAIAQIEEARRIGNGKPVYVFLWPQYHDSNLKLGGHNLPEDYWLLELETAKQYADGIVIWGGWDLKMHRPMIWDDSASWWKITKEFMKSGDQSQPGAPSGITIR